MLGYVTSNVVGVLTTRSPITILCLECCKCEYGERDTELVRLGLPPQNSELVLEGCSLDRILDEFDMRECSKCEQQFPTLHQANGWA